MPSTIDSSSSDTSQQGQPEITVGFVNNMPDSAFFGTEHQFTGLIEEASRNIARVKIECYALPSVSRGSKIAHYIQENYLDAGTLPGRHPDAVIVTGAEPLAATLSNEIYWRDLTELLTRTVATTHSVLLSCLAAHAWLLLSDAIERVRLPYKRTGVFVQDHIQNHSLTEGLSKPLVFPHSRLNDVSTETISAAGYQVLVASHVAGWTVASRPIKSCELVLVQGHPEYSASTLLREYRRDAERYLTGMQVAIPILPEHCVVDEDAETIKNFHQRLSTKDIDPVTLRMLPFDDLIKRTDRPWRSAAIRLYSNWIAGITQRAAVPRHEPSF